MKNLDLKKLLVFIGIIAVVALSIFLIIKSLGNNKPTEEETKDVESLSIDYYASLTAGYNTSYNGLDVLFATDKTTVDDLNYNCILNTAIKYATDKGIDLSVPSNVLTILGESGTYGNINDYVAYNGVGVRNAIKELFGITKTDTTILGNFDFLYDFYYVKKYDMYLVKRSKATDNSNSYQSIDYSIIETTKKKDKLSTTIAIAYVYNDGSAKIYAKDKLGENIVSEDSKEFPKDKIDEFDKFTITLKQSENDKYVFESIEKVK